jgi:L-ascorbate 6-phosphate lactonase
MIRLADKVMESKLGKTYLYASGQAGYIIKSASGQLLAIDLYLSNCLERTEGHKGFKRLLPRILEPEELFFDVIICTHPHLDHFDVDSVPGLLNNNKTKLLCSVDCKKYVQELSLDYYISNIKYVKPGDEFLVGDFKISFVNCDHGDLAPDAVGVVVNVDGKIIYETGDTCLRLDRLDEIPQNVDVLIAPINGAYGNLNESDCVILSENLKPKVTIPCHYGMVASHHGDVGKFDEMMTEKNLPFYLMGLGEEGVSDQIL